MRRFALAALLAAAAARPAPSQEPAELLRNRYDADRAHSSVTFVSRFLRFARVPGRFTDFDATAIYDSANPARSSVTAVIRTASLSTDLARRDAHLKSGDFFDVERFPEIVFQSTRVEPQEGGLLITGDLTMHGVTRSVVLPALLVFPRTFNARSGFARIGFEAHLSLNRQDFGVVGGNRFNPVVTMEGLAIPDTIEITLEMLLAHNGFRAFTFQRTERRQIADTMLTLIGSRGLPAALALYRSVRSSAAADSFLVGEGQLNILGYVLMDRGLLREAIEVLRLNAEQFPDSWNVHDSLGDAYAAAGDRDRALESYRRALAMHPDNTAGMEMVRRMTR